MFHLSACLLSVVLVACGVAREPAAATTTAATHLSPQAAAQATAHSAEIERVDALLAPLIAQFEVPALGAAIVDTTHGLVALGVAGVRERGRESKVTVEDLWHLGSCTKAMTATVAARLVEQKRIAWSTTIGESFPEWKDEFDPKWRDVQLEWLLQNRGGAPGSPPPDLWTELWKRDTDPLAARRWFVESLLRRAPETEPGAKFVYSNQGFVIAGAMLEAATGKSWEELMRTQLFEPLNMAHAGFGAPGVADVLDQPRGHAPDPIQPGVGADNPRALGPAGTVHASLYDWASFIHAHLRGENGGRSILSSAMFLKLHEAPRMQAYAMGWNRTTRPWAGGDVFTHAGSNTMWYCVVWIAPQKDIAFLVTCNQGGDVAAQACDAAVVALAKSRGLL